MNFIAKMRFIRNPCFTRGWLCMSVMKNIFYFIVKWCSLLSQLQACFFSSSFSPSSLLSSPPSHSSNDHRRSIPSMYQPRSTLDDDHDQKWPITNWSSRPSSSSKPQLLTPSPDDAGDEPACAPRAAAAAAQQRLGQRDGAA